MEKVRTVNEGTCLTCGAPVSVDEFTNGLTSATFRDGCDCNELPSARKQAEIHFDSRVVIDMYGEVTAVDVVYDPVLEIWSHWLGFNNKTTRTESTIFLREEDAIENAKQYGVPVSRKSLP